MSGREGEKNQFVAARRQMVQRQLRDRDIVDGRVLAAMEQVPRHRFVLPVDEWAAYDDKPLHIGLGQTISQPYMVARMTELLRLEPGDKVLEIGTGSGYQAAILSRLAGQVWTIERHPSLAERARRLLAGMGYGNVQVLVGDGSRGWAAEAPYDGIVVTAAAPVVPKDLQAQLAPGARLVIPVGDPWSQWLTVVERTEKGFRETQVLGCRFVPLVGEQAYPEDEAL